MTGLAVEPEPAGPDQVSASGRSGGSFRQIFVGSRGRVTLGLMILAVYAVVGLLAPVISEFGPTRITGSGVLQSPSGTHWFGTDLNGMDVFSRTVHAIRIDMGVALAGVALAFSSGAILGVAAGYAQGVVDGVIMRIGDVLQSFPPLIFGLALVAVAPDSLLVIVVVLAVLDAPVFARLVRTETVLIRSSGYVEAAQAAGCSNARILTRHVLPNALVPVLYQGAVRYSVAVKVVAGLAFVGVGIQAPTAEWGAMIQQSTRDVVIGVWWTSLFPGLAIVGVALALNLISDGTQEQVRDW